MKKRILFCLFSSICILSMNAWKIQAATNEQNKVILMSTEISAEELLAGEDVISFEDVVFKLDNGEEVRVTSEISKEENLLDEAVDNRFERTWTGCYASPGSYYHKYTFTVDRAPYKGTTLVGNTRFKLTTSSIAIETVNTGGTKVMNATYTSSAEKIHSTLAQFNFKLNHPGGGAYQAQSKEYTLETQLGFANTSAGLMYRTRLTAYY